ncbi:MAG TPA: hypothetical protein VE955_07235 [Candidatus Dormibacteraeota bacterium]|jgi:thiamine pyrophosphate-dependent acetolactate synthase large subunit-like protein|nr:hypothetical protein [Candidatus Dormibacteraeota bacterium]
MLAARQSTREETKQAADNAENVRVMQQLRAALELDGSFTDNVRDNTLYYARTYNFGQGDQIISMRPVSMDTAIKMIRDTQKGS